LKDNFSRRFTIYDINLCWKPVYRSYECIYVKPRRISNIKLQNRAWINVTVIPKTEMARKKMKRACRSR